MIGPRSEAWILEVTEMTVFPMRWVVMGTGPFAVPTFEALLESPHHVLGLVTRPDRPVHDKHKQSALRNPMREVAERSQLEIFAPESINSAEAIQRLSDWRADLFVVCDYGQILSREALALARLGGINLHGSLLPKYRGAAPIQWAIFHGETETGVSVIHMTPRLDAGPVLVQRRLAIKPDETAGQLEARLASLGPDAVLEAIGRLAEGDTSGIPQDPTHATKAPRIKKADGLIDWSRSAEQICNQIRAMDPWPRAYTFWLSSDVPPLRLILDEVAVQAETLPVEPGTIQIADASAGVLSVACGSGSLMIHRLQPSGKRPMTAGEFLRGHPLRAGDRFGNSPETPTRSVSEDNGHSN
jgi:methionyl-tRNA formyltransferase